MQVCRKLPRSSRNPQAILRLVLAAWMPLVDSLVESIIREHISSFALSIITDSALPGSFRMCSAGTDQPISTLSYSSKRFVKKKINLINLKNDAPFCRNLNLLTLWETWYVSFLGIFRSLIDTFVQDFAQKLIS